METVEQQVLREEAEERAAEIKRRENELAKKRKATNAKISGAIRANVKGGRGRITSKTTRAELNAALRRAAGRPSEPPKADDA